MDTPSTSAATASVKSATTRKAKKGHKKASRKNTSPKMSTFKKVCIGIGILAGLGGLGYAAHKRYGNSSPA